VPIDTSANSATLRVLLISTFRSNIKSVGRVGACWPSFTKQVTQTTQCKYTRASGACQDRVCVFRGEIMLQAVRQLRRRHCEFPMPRGRHAPRQWQSLRGAAAPKQSPSCARDCFAKGARNDDVIGRRALCDCAASFRTKQSPTREGLLTCTAPAGVTLLRCEPAFRAATA